MRGLNRVEIIGNLGADPELRYTPKGRAVANFRVAVNRRWRDDEGQQQERTDWFRCVAWGHLAEVVNQFASKGSPIYVEGRLETRSYEKEGKTLYFTELVAREIIILPRGGSSRGMGEPPAEVEEGAEADPWAEEESELPL